jgi:MFS family permease
MMARESDRRELGVDYWRLWTSSGLSNMADGVVKVALPLVALHYTRSPGLIAGLAFAFTLPWLVFALPAGAVSDRSDRRRAMIGMNLIRAALLGGLAVTAAVGAESIWALYVVAVAVGTAETIYDTSAQSILPQLVDRDALPRANGRLFGMEVAANQFIGPPLAGVLAASGAVLAFVTPTALWLVAVAMLWRVRGSFRPSQAERGGARSSIRAEIGEGLQFLRSQRLLRRFAAMTGAFNFATNAVFAIFVLYAVGPSSAMGLSQTSFGLLLTTDAAGSLAGSFLAESLQRRLGRARTLTVGLIAAAALVGISALTANPYLIGAVFFLGGVGNVIANVVMVSLRQSITPDRLLGRVNSCYRLLAWGTMPIGAAVGGVLAEAVGLRPVFVVMGAIAVAVAAASLTINDAALDAANASPAP